MKQVGAFEAKTHFSQLLAQVMQGKSINITKHGKVVAVLSPVCADAKDPVIEAMEGIRQLRKGVKLGKGLTIKDLINEGRR